MVARVTGGPASWAAGRPEPLFDVYLPTRGFVGGGRYAMSRDGQRFLVDTAVDQTSSTPLTLVVNWAAALRK